MKEKIKEDLEEKEKQREIKIFAQSNKLCICVCVYSFKVSRKRATNPFKKVYYCY